MNQLLESCGATFLIGLSGGLGLGAAVLITMVAAAVVDRLFKRSK